MVFFVIWVVYCSRTSEYWSAQVIENWKVKKEADNSLPILSEKEIKREGFLLSEIRYTVVVTVLCLRCDHCMLAFPDTMNCYLCWRA
jgi:hypothetical protein